MESIEFKPKQLLRFENINSIFCINKVTEKAILIECDNGKWIDDGTFKPLWIPKSILHYLGFNDKKDNSQYGIHIVNIPEWFVNQNSKLI